MQILLMRHGSASWEAHSDAERNLTPRGEAEVAAASLWLEQFGWQPDEIWHSPYHRAMQTAAIMNRPWALPLHVCDALTPDAQLSHLENQLASCAAERLLLIGHNPLFSNAFNIWCADSFRGWSLQPASLAFMVAELIAEGCGKALALRHFPNYEHNAL